MCLNISVDFLTYFAAFNTGIINEEILGVKKREGKDRIGGGLYVYELSAAVFLVLEESG